MTIARGPGRHRQDPPDHKPHEQCCPHGFSRCARACQRPLDRGGTPAASSQPTPQGSQGGPCLCPSTPSRSVLPSCLHNTPAFSATCIATAGEIEERAGHIAVRIEVSKSASLAKGERTRRETAGCALRASSSRPGHTQMVGLHKRGVGSHRERLSLIGGMLRTGHAHHTHVGLIMTAAPPADDGPERKPEAPEAMGAGGALPPS